MNPKAIVKAQSRYRVAAKALDEMRSCTDFVEFTDIWYSFITATKSIYTALEQGAKTSAQSRQWFGGKATHRRKDELLQYLYQARNDDEHGLEQVVELEPGYTVYGKSAPGFSNHMSFSASTDANGKLSFSKMESLDGKPILIENKKPSAKLIDVKDRSGKSYSPPNVHGGVLLTDISPLRVAELAMGYFEGLLEEASSLK